MGLADTSIRLYQRYISRDYNGSRQSSCAYWPSCSEHVRQSLENDGLVEGGLHGLERFVSCGPAAHQRNVEEYLGQLHHDPKATMAATVTDGPEARQHLDRLKSLADRYVPGLEAGERLADLELRQQWAEVSADFQLLRLDEPGCQDNHRFMVRRRTAPPPEPARSPLATAAGWLGAAAGACVGALAGAVIGPVAALALNVSAARGGLDPVLERQEERYGEPGVKGLRRHLKPLLGPAEAIRGHFQGTAGTIASAVVGGLWSLPVGVAVGLFGGGRTGAAFGKSLAANLTRASLSPQTTTRYNRETSQRGDHPCTAEPSTTFSTADFTR